MLTKRYPSRAVYAWLFVMFSNSANGIAQEPQMHEFIVRNVRLFDGYKVSEGVDVAVASGKIKKVGKNLEIKEGSDIVEGSGHTLLPGFIDAHVHSSSEEALVQCVVFGVTSTLDMLANPLVATQLRNTPGSEHHERADFYSAGIAVTVKDGHGSQYFEVPVLEGESAAMSFIHDRVREGADYIKIIYDDGEGLGFTKPTLTIPMLRASINAAHEYKKLAVAHIGSLRGARESVECGIDGLVHLFANTAIDKSLVDEIRSKRVFIVPTCVVTRMVCGSLNVDTILKDPHFAPFLSDDNIRRLMQAYPKNPGSTNDYEHMRYSISKLIGAGVPILAGTDAPNPGTTFGASLHHEIELLVDAGLTNQQALSAATALPAAHFHLDDRGEIKPGLRADLVLVDGNPLEDITHTRRIVSVWKGGQKIDRQLYGKQIHDAKMESLAKLADESKLISDFENGKAESSIGDGWDVLTDSVFGGKSTASMEVKGDGKGNSKHCLKVSGEVQEGGRAFAGVMLHPSKGNQPTDLSKYSQFDFFSTSTQKDLQVMLFFKANGPQPAVKSFSAGMEWSKASFKFRDFGGCDGTDVIGIFVGTFAKGKFEFEIDDFQLVPAKP